MLQTRRVAVSRLQQVNGVGPWVLTVVGEATFHQFGVGYEEFEAGPGNFSTAIIEWPSGQVESVPANHIRFLE